MMLFITFIFKNLFLTVRVNEEVGFIFLYFNIILQDNDMRYFKNLFTKS